MTEDDILIPDTPEDWEEKVKLFLNSVYQVTETSGFLSPLSTSIPQSVNRLLDLIIESKLFGYETKAELARDCIVKWILLLATRLHKGEVALLSAQELSAIHSIQHRTRRLRAGEFVSLAEEELSFYLNLGDLNQAKKSLLFYIDLVNGLQEYTARKIWKAALRESQIINKVLDTLINKGDPDAMLISSGLE